VGKLVAESKKTVTGLIAEGFKQNWGEKTVVDKFSKAVAESILSLHELVSTVSERSEYINSIVQTLGTCPLESEVLQEKLRSIQEVIDEFDLKNVSNLHIWVPELNKQLENVFAKRLEVLVKEWVAEFLSYKSLEEEGAHKLLKDATRHELKTENNVFYLDPPMEFAKFSWLQEFHRTLGIICSLPKLGATRYMTSLASRSSVENFESVLQKVPASVLKVAYSEIYRVFKEAEQYIGIWLNY
jgi:dynein heavy chain 1